MTMTSNGHSVVEMITDEELTLLPHYRVLARHDNPTSRRGNEVQELGELVHPQGCAVRNGWRPRQIIVYDEI